MIAAGTSPVDTPVDTPVDAPLADALAARFAVPVSGPSYRLAARVVALAMIALMALYGARVVLAGGFGAAGWAVIAGGAAALAVTGWSVFAGRTTVDTDGIRQTGVPSRAFRWSEIARARVVRMPLTSRLLVSTGTGPLRALHAGTPALDAAFAEIGARYAVQR